MLQASLKLNCYFYHQLIMSMRAMNDYKHSSHERVWNQYQCKRHVPVLAYLWQSPNTVPMYKPTLQSMHMTP